ncbi:MAG: hypothetical protein ACYCSF_03260 [Acidimicrobiales bacterium]
MVLSLMCIAGLLAAAVIAVWARARPGAVILFVWLTTSSQGLRRRHGHAMPGSAGVPLPLDRTAARTSVPVSG